MPLFIKISYEIMMKDRQSIFILEQRTVYKRAKSNSSSPRKHAETA